MAQSKTEKQLQFMLEFRKVFNDFLQVKFRILELKKEAQQQSFHSLGFEKRFEGEIQELARNYYPARTEVARRMSEAKEIADQFEMKTVLTISPPPLVGGFIHRMDIFEAAISENTPYEFEVNYREIVDTIDQTIFALERQIKNQPSIVKETLSGAPGQVFSGVRWFFPSQLLRFSFGWLVVLILLGVFLRYVLGIPINVIGDYLVKKYITK